MMEANIILPQGVSVMSSAKKSPQKPSNPALKSVQAAPKVADVVQSATEQALQNSRHVLEEVRTTEDVEVMKFQEFSGDMLKDVNAFFTEQSEQMTQAFSVLSELAQQTLQAVTEAQQVLTDATREFAEKQYSLQNERVSQWVDGFRQCMECRTATDAAEVSNRLAREAMERQLSSVSQFADDYFQMINRVVEPLTAAQADFASRVGKLFSK